MEDKPNENRPDNLPPSATEFVRQVVRNMGWSKRAREEVAAELAAHFEDELRDCTDARERERRVLRLVEQFGDAKVLAVLCRRGKKRCRPLGVRIIVRSLQAAGVFVVLLGLYVIWFVNGKPTIKVDYLAVLNQMSRPQAPEQDNAWPYYEHAMALLTVPDREAMKIPAYRHPEFVEPPELDHLTEDTRRAVAEWIDANHDAWEEFMLAGTKPYCLKPYEYDDEKDESWLIKVKLPDPEALWQLSRMGICLSRLRVRQGRIGDALEACLGVARAGRHWQQSGTSPEQLMGISLSQRAHEEILTILGHQKLSVAELTRLQRGLASVYPQSYPLLDFKERRLLFLDVLQHLFTDGGPGGGHLIPSRVSEFLGIVMTTDPVPLEGTPMNWKMLSFVHAGRDETLAKAREIFDLQDKFVKMSPYERRALGGTRADLAFESRPQLRYALVQMLTPAPDREADLAFQAKALHEATLTILALQRYRQEKGSYPAALDELKRAGYLDTLPADPYSAESLSYKISDSSFALYSLGPDFRDDAGESFGPAQDGRPKPWADQGDTVFWPVPAR
jgi:hypothetical protein